MLVTFLWSTSFVIIKLGLKEIPPLTFAGFRYFIAFLCLLPFTLSKEKLSKIRALKKGDWIKLILLGILFYAFTQGAQFVGLSLLSSVTVSLWLNFTPIVVAVLGIVILSENPTKRQWFGTFLFIFGILVYFFPINLAGSEITGLLVMTLGVLANAGSAILGRDVNRSGTIHPLIITVVSMGIGAVLLLGFGIVFQGLPAVSFTSVIYILWLAILNTAVAFVLWNVSLRTLTAMESSIINGTMLIQIAVLAWIFLGESISLQEGFGMLIAALGAVLVQLKNRKAASLKR